MAERALEHERLARARAATYSLRSAEQMALLCATLILVEHSEDMLVRSVAADENKALHRNKEILEMVSFDTGIKHIRSRHR
jgi:hypothetical protein